MLMKFSELTGLQLLKIGSFIDMKQRFSEAYPKKFAAFFQVI